MIGRNTVKPVLETIRIKQSTAVRDHYSEKTLSLKTNLIELAFKDHLL